MKKGLILALFILYLLLLLVDLGFGLIGLIPVVGDLVAGSGEIIIESLQALIFGVVALMVGGNSK